MLRICESSICTGCGLCKNLCASNAISMETDKRGFCYPQIDENKCSKCGQCIRFCPNNSVNHLLNDKPISVFAAINRNDEVRNNCSSGGIFFALAEEILLQGGAVCGAMMKDDLSVHHMIITTKNELKLLTGSKYIPSLIDDCYQEVKLRLDNGQKVLFSGTPCQVAAMKRFVGVKRDNLLLVDVLCHGVPSPRVFLKFTRAKEEEENSKIVSVNFRAKNPGWSSYGMELTFENEARKIDNGFINLFLSDRILRNSCHNCRYACATRTGDITLGDFWGYQESWPEYLEDDDRGMSLVLINSECGKQLFKKIKYKLSFAKRTLDQASLRNPVLTNPTIKNRDSEAFMIDLELMDWDSLLKKYGISTDFRKSDISFEKRRYYAIPYNMRRIIHWTKAFGGSLFRKVKKVIT